MDDKGENQVSELQPTTICLGTKKLQFPNICVMTMIDDRVCNRFFTILGFFDYQSLSSEIKGIDVEVIKLFVVILCTILCLYNRCEEI